MCSPDVDWGLCKAGGKQGKHLLQHPCILSLYVWEPVGPQILEPQAEH